MLLKQSQGKDALTGAFDKKYNLDNHEDYMEKVERE